MLFAREGGRVTLREVSSLHKNFKVNVILRNQLLKFECIT